MTLPLDVLVNPQIFSVKTIDINTKDDYRQYLLNKQEMIDKEKEEENMEIYQNMLKEKENQEREKELYRQYL